MQSILPAMEIEVDRNDSYTELVERAAEAFSLSEKPGQMLMLFKMNGSTIPNSSLTVKEKKREWTLGNYLLATKKSPAQTKLGVGYLSNTAFDSSSEEEVKTIIFRLLYQKYIIVFLNCRPNHL